MNAALPIVVLAVGASLWLSSRRSRWHPVAFACVVATLLLSPSLLRPHAVPSPAGQLLDHAPWQDPSARVERNDELRDVTYQVEPWLLFLRSELRRGRLPFWNDHQQAGTPYWANGSSAPLFPLHLLFVVLPLELGFVLLPWLRVVVAVWGTWLLGAELGLERGGCAFAAVTFALAGMPVAFLLYPMGSAIALAPWVLWATERLAAGRASWRPLAVAAALQFLAGHPETSVHTAFLCGLYLIVRPGARDLARWRGTALAWTTAAGVGMVHLLPFALFVRTTSRWLQWESMDRSVDLSVVLPQIARLVLPSAFGSSWNGTWFGPFTPMALSLYLGGLGLVLAVDAMLSTRFSGRLRAVVVLTLVSLLAALHVPPIVDAIELVPVVGRALHHRLVFGFQLGAALLAGVGLDRWRRTGTVSRLPLGIVFVAIGVAWVGLFDSWQDHGLLAPQVLSTSWMIAVAAILGFVGRRAAIRQRIGIVLVGLAALDLLAAHVRVNPTLPIDRIFPLTPAVEQLVGRPERVVGVGYTYHPNAAMVHGLFDVRGDDSVKLDRYERAYQAAFGAGHPTYFVPVREWNEEALDRFSVRWVMGPPESRAPGVGWKLTYDGKDARIWERPSPRPMVRWSDSGEAGGLEVVQRRSGLWVVALRAEIDRSLEIGEVWCEGWRARIDGHTVEVMQGDPFMRIDVPAGARRIEVAFRPPGLVLGLALSIASIGLLAISGFVARRSAATPTGEGGLPG